VILEEIKRSEDDPDDLVHEYFDRHLFGSHPYARPIIGTAENIRRFQRDDLVAYTEKFYTSENIILVAAGNITHDQMVKLAERFFTGKRSVNAKRKSFSAVRSTRVSIEYPKPIQQAHVLTGTVAFNAHHAMRYPGMVMNSILGDGMSSRLFQEIREKHGLAYSVYSFLSLAKETGVFGVYVGTDKGSVKKATDLAYAVLEKIKNVSLRKSELNRAKAQLKGNMLMSLESTSNRMMRLGSGELYFGEYRTLDSIVRNIDAVTAEDVQRTATKLFDINKFTTVVLMPQQNTK
jgi:predicted Zn-dependent peptidase